MLSGENIWYRPQVRAEDRAIANRNMREQQQKDRRKQQQQQQQQKGSQSYGRPDQQHQVLPTYLCSPAIALYCTLFPTPSPQSLQASRYRSAEEERAEAAHSALRHPLGDHFTYLHIFQEWERCAFSNSWCEQNFINHRSMKTVRQIRYAYIYTVLCVYVCTLSMCMYSTN